MEVMPTSQMSLQPCQGFTATWNVKSLTTDGPPVAGQPITWVIAGPLTTRLVAGAVIKNVLAVGSLVVCTLDTDVGEIVRLPVSPSSSWTLTYTFAPSPASAFPPYSDISSKFSMTNGDGSPVACFQTTFACQPS
jgi:hypothetical protein